MSNLGDFQFLFHEGRGIELVVTCLRSSQSGGSLPLDRDRLARNGGDGGIRADESHGQSGRLVVVAAERRRSQIEVGRENGLVRNSGEDDVLILSRSVGDV